MIDCSAWRRLSCSPPVTSTHSSTTPVLWRHCSLACRLGAYWSCVSHALILNDRLRWVVLGVFPSKTALSILVVILTSPPLLFPSPPPQKKRKKKKEFGVLFVCIYLFLFFQGLWACSVNVEGFYMLYELTLHYTALQYSLFCMKTDIGHFLKTFYEVLRQLLSVQWWISQANWSFGYVYICLCAACDWCTNQKVDLLCVDNKSKSRSIACRQQIRK